jgi:hypothetical protein
VRRRLPISSHRLDRDTSCLYLVTFTHVPSGADVSIRLLAGSETMARWAARLLLNPDEPWRFQRLMKQTDSTGTATGSHEPPPATPTECTSGRAGYLDTCMPGAHRPPCPLATGRAVRCKLCRQRVPRATALRHGRGWVGECCWDERLRASQ